MAVAPGISFAKLLYQPIFDRLGVAAKLNLDAGQFDIIALDKTVGVSLPQAGGAIVETLTPMVELMMADLIRLGVSPDDLDNREITIFPPGSDTSDVANGKTWHIISHKLNPSNSGIADGTIYLQLEGAADD